MNKIKIEFELNVPSGSMVFSDSLPEFQIFGSFDTNTEDGLKKQTMAMARIGCAHGFVGNSCPRVYRVDDKTILVANVPVDEETGEPKNTPGEYLAQIITDLWWYSFVDAEEYERRGGKKHNGFGFGRIKVRPGVYKFSHALRTNDNDNELRVYAIITWVREPDPIKDYLKEFRELNLTTEQIINHMLKQWPNMYTGDDAIIRAADYIFCVSGTGGDWHPNGFIQYDPDTPIEPVDLVVLIFDKVFNWYPLCEYSALVQAANGEFGLNPSFAKLAKNVARCIVKHGGVSSVCSVKDNHKNQALAIECLEKLEARYP